MPRSSLSQRTTCFLRRSMLSWKGHVRIKRPLRLYPVDGKRWMRMTDILIKKCRSRRESLMPLRRKMLKSIKWFQRSRGRPTSSYSSLAKDQRRSRRKERRKSWRRATRNEIWNRKEKRSLNRLQLNGRGFLKRRKLASRENPKRRKMSTSPRNRQPISRSSKRQNRELRISGLATSRGIGLCIISSFSTSTTIKNWSTYPKKNDYE